MTMQTSKGIEQKANKLIALEMKIAECEDRLANAEYDSVIDRLEDRLERLQEQYDAVEYELDELQTWASRETARREK